MRLASSLGCLAPALAAADSFGGFSKLDRPYLVNQDKVCTPVKVANGAATGMPACQKAATDVVAHLDIKSPVAQAGTGATFTATVSGKTITIAKRSSGAPVVTWSALDPIGRVVDLFVSEYEDRVAVTYTTRVAGKEITNVIGFDLQGASTVVAPVTPVTPVTPTVDAPPVDPAVAKALAAAHKASKAKAIAAWKAVLAIDPDNSEALYGMAQAQQKAKAKADALDTLKKLRASSRPDAVEWLVEARFDTVFAALRTDPDYRDVVGIGKAPANTYERLMGLGGQWEQTGTPCDKAQVNLTLLRDRTFKLKVKTRCEGQVFDTPFKGSWRIDGTAIVFTVPTKGKAVAADDQAACQLVTQGDEDALNCSIGRDIEFSVLPTRR